MIAFAVTALILFLLYRTFAKGARKYKPGDILASNDGLTVIKVIGLFKEGYLYKYLMVDGRHIEASELTHWIPGWYADKFFRKPALLRSVK